MTYQPTPVRPPIQGEMPPVERVAEGPQRAALKPWMLKSHICHCGAPKAYWCKFCDACWHKLPREVRELMKTDFDTAFEAALLVLGWK